MFEVDEMEGCHSCKYGDEFDTDKEPCKYCYGLSLYTKKETKMMEDYEVGIDFTVKEIEAIERVQRWEARDDADMRRAIHQMITDLAEIRNIDISDIGLEDD